MYLKGTQTYAYPKAYKYSRSTRYFKRPSNYLFKVVSYGSDPKCNLFKLETMDFIFIIHNTLNV